MYVDGKRVVGIERYLVLASWPSVKKDPVTSDQMLAAST